MLLLGLALLPPPVWGHPSPSDRFPNLHRRIDTLLEAEGLDREGVALSMFSTKRRRFLYRRQAETAMVAASNAKLATTYAALQVLRPNYRWKTTFYLITPPPEHPDGGRQGLLVQGGGDPTLSSAGLDAIALELRARGLRRVGGALYYDESLFDQVRYPAAWGGAVGTQSWFAPVSPFILDKNAAEFFIVSGPDGGAIEVIPRALGTFVQVVSRLTSAPDPRLLVYVEQSWDARGARFTFKGKVPDTPGTHQFATAVTDPVFHFLHRLRQGLHRAGVVGEMPLRPLPAGEFGQQVLHAHYSNPLREIIAEVNKESNNLTAEVVLRALALTREPERASGEMGLAVMREALGREFPGFEDQFHFADGSGLSRETRMSASFLVHLLNRVLARKEFRSEYLASLSLAGLDGTLKYRRYPERIWGRLRAKSGTLRGVQNLSGYLYPLTDTVVFSFLINHGSGGFAALQAAQDRVMVGIFDFLLAQEAPATAKAKPGAPPPPSDAVPPPESAPPESAPPAPAADPRPRDGGKSLTPPPVSFKLGR